MREDFYNTGDCGIVPNNLPGGFFIYDADEGEKILFAENNTSQKNTLSSNTSPSGNLAPHSTMKSRR